MDRNHSVELETKGEIQIQTKYTIVYLSGAVCRKTKDLSSEQIGTLPFDTNVTVEKIDGRRCLISSPIYGWISTRTADGRTILEIETTNVNDVSNTCMGIEANMSAKTHESHNKQKLQILLFVINLLTFIISMMTLILSFDELVHECASRKVDPSAPYVSYPICYSYIPENSIYGDCDTHPDLKTHTYWTIYKNGCENMQTDYGCGCEALNECEDFNNEYCPGDWGSDCQDCSGDACSDCDAYTCAKYGLTYCRDQKYTMFIILVMFELLIGIPQYGATYWEEKMKQKKTVYHRICCQKTMGAKICTKALQNITSWMINFSIYSLSGGIAGFAHFEWLFIFLFLAYLIMAVALFQCKHKDHRLCTRRQLCNLSEVLANEFVPFFGCVLALFFFPFIFLPGGEVGIDGMISSINTLFVFDFKVRLFIGMHTVHLLLTQIVSTIRSDICTYCPQNNPQAADLCNAIESSMKQIDLVVSDTNKCNEIKQVKKHSVVEDDNNYGQPTQYNDPQPVNSFDGAPDVGQTVSFAEAQKLNVPNKETYLHDNEFEQIFGMTKDEFYQQRPWKQKNLKRAKGLF